MAFNPKTTKRSLENAFATAQAAGLAYADEGGIRAGLRHATGMEVRDFRLFSIASHNTSVYMAKFDAAIIVAFRGTVDARDWLTDFQVSLVPFAAGGFVHIGFRDALASVIDDINITLAAWSGGGRTLWITGHSLGGALALLLGANLRFPPDPTKVLPRPIAGLYTFGQPRVGTLDFCDVCDNNFGDYYFRWVNKQDIVTRVPPRVLAYWHISSVEYITNTGAIEDDPAWWQIFLDAVEAGLDVMAVLRTGGPLAELVGDHAINNYIAAIGAAVAKPAAPQVPRGV